ncbi:WYL domain-containing protein [Neiella marina]|uniref:WYL domain-containing protein n=1 Tax=Neiella holothuriorum TaxID=2870530 RepID=A0ABS7EGX5_9GAMM|nr:WYL domain-containing protein [Neiella holothuriorum]MBW8191596.1 WYL domain-containing protein [Neiella holothuriorum]
MEHQNFAQKQRLAYIDFKLLFTGYIMRSEIVTRFELGLAAASRDLSLYKERAPDNMRYDNGAKKYFITNGFKPIFKHDTRTSLMKIAHQISDSFDAVGDVDFPVTAPTQLNVPDLFVVARLSQAVINQRPVKVTYTSLTSGTSERVLVPHTIVDNGLRWHVRAYDRKTQSFRDFVLTRISDVAVLADSVDEVESASYDTHWQAPLTLELVPHPVNVQHPQAIEMDYGMDEGVLAVNTKVALAGYLLRRWNVDCSGMASLRGAAYQLHLRNSNVLDGINELVIAPGYSGNKSLNRS